MQKKKQVTSKGPILKYKKGSLINHNGEIWEIAGIVKKGNSHTFKLKKPKK
jgi:hypothetical protein